MASLDENGLLWPCSGAGKSNIFGRFLVMCAAAGIAPEEFPTIAAVIEPLPFDEAQDLVFDEQTMQRLKDLIGAGRDDRINLGWFPWEPQVATLEGMGE